MHFPVDDIISDLKAALTARPSAILVAEPGAGKTTRVPLALLKEIWAENKKIVMLEPRRLAARAAATRMAETLNEAVGETVGYTVRLDRKVSVRTRIEVVTEGILTRRLQSDPELADTALVIFDEFHERNLDGDLGLALCLDVQANLRPDLKLLIMSATLDVGLLQNQMRGALSLVAKGRMFPVKTHYLEKATRQTIVTDVVRAVNQVAQKTKGSMLVFLPGESEIRRVAAELNRDLPDASTDIRPLYGAMALGDQDEAIKPSSPSRRKIVLATTIAETSLTIEGITAVIDSGFKRVARFDPASGMTGLETIRVSQASAEQRRGRAGRLGPGECFRLWPEVETKALKPHDAPEIENADMAQLVLELANWGVARREGFPWIEEPPAGAFSQAQGLLKQLGALDGAFAITRHGKAMARLALHPRLSHMVLTAHEKGSGKAAAEMAALIAERDGLPRDTTADAETRMMQLKGFARDRWKQTVKQILSQGGIKGDDESPLAAGVLLALAYPDRIAQQRGGHGRFRMAGGQGAVLEAHDPMARSEFIAIALLHAGQGEAQIFLAGTLTRDDIDRHFSELVTTDERVFWDLKSQSVSALRVINLGALVLEERPLTDADPEQVVAAMVEGVRAMGLNCLPSSEAAQMFRSRINFLRRVLPERQWPDLSDDHLLATIAQWLAPYLAAITRKAHLQRLDMLMIMRSLVPPEFLAKLDTLAPARMQVPGGGFYKVDYEGEGDPVLRVRLQELFGLHTTPVIAGGKARLKIELLSPAGRPVAVTQSLETFWINAYPDVRKDLRGRYPKQFWPEDPLTAQAVAPRKLR